MRVSSACAVAVVTISSVVVIKTPCCKPEMQSPHKVPFQIALKLRERPPLTTTASGEWRNGGGGGGGGCGVGGLKGVYLATRSTSAWRLLSSKT